MCTGSLSAEGSVVPRNLLEVTRPRTRRFALYALFAVYANRNTALLKMGVVSIESSHEANPEQLSDWQL